MWYRWWKETIEGQKFSKSLIGKLWTAALTQTIYRMACYNALIYTATYSDKFSVISETLTAKTGFANITTFGFKSTVLIL